MRGNESIEIAKMEARTLVGTADCADYQRSGWNCVGSENFRAVHLTLAIQTDEPCSHRAAGQRRRFSDLAGSSLQYGGNDLAISSAAAEHSADRIHDGVFARRRTALQQSSGCHQHARRAGAA